MSMGKTGTQPLGENPSWASLHLWLPGLTTYKGCSPFWRAEELLEGSYLKDKGPGQTSGHQVPTQLEQCLCARSFRLAYLIHKQLYEVVAFITSMLQMKKLRLRGVK